ncbi:MAG: hypothetical protein EP344_04175 [Bacteroidetes bacterium]|nr:MAG: hypothetical protein EP344_04175 [Bacteroidota bacterium]
MKNLTLLLALASLFITACDKDKSPEEQLNGTWTISSLTVAGDQVVGTSTYNTTEINANGNIIQVAVVETTTATIEFHATGTVLLTSNTETTANPGGMSSDTESNLGTYTITGDKQLTLHFPDVDGEAYTFEGTVGILTDTDLQYSGTLTLDSDPTDQGLFALSASR